MRSINKVILVGNLTKDPVKKESQTGHSFTTFTVATNREWYSANGEKNTTTEFHRIAAWGKLSDLCNDFLKKGKLVYIEGYLKTRFIEKDGEKNYKTEVILQDMIMLDKKNNNNMGDISGEEILNCSSQENKEDTRSSLVDLDGDYI